MSSLELIKNLASLEFNFKLGSEIGYGAQGRVFNIIDSPNKVIKFSTLYDLPTAPLEKEFKRIKEVYHFLMKNQLPLTVSIFEFSLLHMDVRETVNGPQNYIIYYSIQEKLQPLSEDEKKVFKTICQLVNNELESQRSIEEIIFELGQWFDFNKDKVLSFYFGIQKLAINNNDFHRRNILKDKNGNFKIIDFDLAKLV